MAISAIIYSLLLTNYYRSESILVARDLQSSSTLSQYADFAAIAGIGLPTERGDGVIEVMEIIKSREFVKHLLTFEDILPSLMASKSYDAVSKELYFDPKLYDMKSKTWIREPSGNKGIEPSYLETHEAYLGEVLSISQDIKTGLVYIAIEHISPVFAKEFLALIIKEANSLMNILFVAGYVGVPEQVKKFCPVINTSPNIRYPVLGATLQRRAGTARHDAVAWGYARQADSMGVDIIQHCEVTGFDIKDGKIKFDDIDIRDLNIHSLRKTIGLVSQDIFLFEGTVFENIAYGNLNASFNEIENSCSQAGEKYAIKVRGTF